MHAEIIEITACDTIKNCVNSAAQRLTTVSTTPKLDAETLLAAVLKTTTTYLITWPDKILELIDCQRFNSFILRCEQGEPVPYIVGQKEFWSMALHITTDTLIPRPETELLVEKALVLIPLNKQWRIADLGTGSGAIALAIAKERPHVHIIATDISMKALDVAKKNAISHNLSNIEFKQGGWFDALTDKSFDLILSNPPYIKQDDPHLQALQFEPANALTPLTGKDGLADLQLIIEQSITYLKKEGFLLLEHGHDQQTRLKQLLHKNGYHNIQTINDLAGINRVITAQT